MQLVWYFCSHSGKLYGFHTYKLYSTNVLGKLVLWYYKYALLIYVAKRSIYRKTNTLEMLNGPLVGGEDSSLQLNTEALNKKSALGLFLIVFDADE